MRSLAVFRRRLANGKARKIRLRPPVPAMRAMMIVLLNASAGGGTKDEVPARVSAGLEKLGVSARIEVAENGAQFYERARQAATGKGFPVGWEPLAVQEPLRLRSGSSRGAQVQ